MTGTDLLPSWRDGAARDAIVAFVAAVTAEGGERYVPAAERIATFDNDGKHYRGDDRDVQLLLAALSRTYDGLDVEEYERQVEAFLADAVHPTLGRPYRDCVYRPMVELLAYLRAHGFTTYIASGGDRDFMRPTAMELYGVAREHVIGSGFELDYRAEGEGAVLYTANPTPLDDGPQKPIHIWSRIGRRPLLAFGNADGDVPMLSFAAAPGAGAPLRLLLAHDDEQREFAYDAGAAVARERAAGGGWTVVSMRDDWATVFST